MRGTSRGAARLAGLVLLLSTSAHAQAPPAEPLQYAVDYTVHVVPSESAARVSIRIGAGAGLVDWIDFAIDPDRHIDFAGDGEIVPSADGRRVHWTPPRSGGELRYLFRVDHLRDERSYDARITMSWALFRGDDLVPKARISITDGARSRSRLRMHVPEKWAVAVPYPRLPDGSYQVSIPDRSFDRPVGWMVVGELGVVRERIEDVRVAIAGPRRHGVRRYDMLALLNWTLPSLRSLLGDRLPERFLIVSAGDPMWRGGLSAPHSVFLHAARPLISEDATSPILHELMHTALGLRGSEDGDWIVEGLAEYYSLELLRRSGTISAERAEAAMRLHETRGRRATTLLGRRASGATISRAVVVLRDLDAWLRKRSESDQGLDDVARALARKRSTLTLERFQDVVLSATGVDAAPFLATVVGAPPN